MTTQNKNKLFNSANLGKLKLKNRFVRSATWENMTTEDGHMTDKLYNIYEELAKNEVGLLITGYANIVKEEQPNHGMMGIYDDSFIDGYKKLTNIVHSYDSKIIMQIAYGGSKSKYNIGERIIFAPSSIAEKNTGTMGKEMTKEDIDYITEAFACAAERVKKSGFDGVEIHGAHTYLINQFLSPYYNQRTDEYGGSLENRMRFLAEIYEKTRAKVGDNFPIFVKLTATEFFNGGLTFKESRQICKFLDSLGVDGIELSGNIHGKAKSMVGQSFDGCTIQKEGFFVEYAKIISEEIKAPVITVGGFENLSTIEKIYEDTNIGFFGLSRPLLAEPDLINKWKSGISKSCKCIRCSKCRTSEGNYCVIFDR